MRLSFILLSLVLLSAQAFAAPPVVPLPGAPPMPPPGGAPMVFAPPQQGLRISGVGLPHYLSMPVMRQRSFTGSGTIQGRVMDADHDRPIPDAIVVLLSAEKQRQQWQIMARASVEANSRGEFIFEGVPAGLYLLDAYHVAATLVPWNFVEPADQLIELKDEETREDVLAFVYGGHQLVVTLNGFVPPSGNSPLGLGTPFRGVNLTATRRFLFDEGEVFRLGGSGVSNASLWDPDDVVVNNVFGREIRLDFDFADNWVRGENGERINFLDLTLDPDELRVEVVLDLQPSPILRGRIVREEGQGVGAGTVSWLENRSRSILPPGFAEQQTAVIGANGGFEVRIPGRSDGTLEIDLDGVNPIHYGVISFAESFPDDLEIDLPEPATMVVTVRDADESLVPGAKVTATIADYGSVLRGTPLAPRLWYFPPPPDPDGADIQQRRAATRTFEATTNDEGMARIEGMAEGRFALRAVKADEPQHAPSREYTVDVQFGRESVLTLTLEKRLPFGGVVLDEQGEPLPFAAVILNPVAPEEPPRQVTADREGRFRLEGVGPEELLNVQVNKPGVDVSAFNMGRLNAVGSYLPGMEDAVLQLGRPTFISTTHYTIIDALTGERVQGGTLKTHDGKPVLHVTEPEPGVIANLKVTDPVDMRTASSYLLVVAEGYAPQPVYTRPNDRREVRLSPPVSIRGRVLDAISKQPLEGANVSYMALQPLAPGPHRQPPPFVTQTNEDGKFVLANVPAAVRQAAGSRFVMLGANERLLSISKDPDYPPMARALEFEEYTDLDVGDVLLGAGLDLPVNVTLEGMPMANVEVHLLRYDSTNAGSTTGEAPRMMHTDEQGKALFGRLPASSYTILLPDYDLGRMVELKEFRIGVRADLGRGRIQLQGIHNGTPTQIAVSGSLSGAMGLRRGSTARLASDRDGGLVVQHLPRGEWRLNASLTRSILTTMDLVVDLNVNSEPACIPVTFGSHDVRVQVEPHGDSGRVSGYVFLTPLEQMMPCVHKRYRGSRDVDGFIHLDEIPAGRYMVTYISRNYPIEWAVDEIDLTGERGQTELKLTKATAGSVINVRARSAFNGQPLANWTASADLIGRSGSFGMPRANDGVEMIRFDNLPPDEIRITVSADYHRTKTEVIRVGRDEEQDVEVRLEPVGRLTLTLATSAAGEGTPDPGQSPLRAVYVRSLDDDSLEPAYRFVTNRQAREVMHIPLAAGRHELQLVENGNRVIASRKVEIALFQTNQLSMVWEVDDDE
jgi:hypothetical protein